MSKFRLFCIFWYLRRVHIVFLYPIKTQYSLHLTDSPSVHVYYIIQNDQSQVTTRHYTLRRATVPATAESAQVLYTVKPALDKYLSTYCGTKSANGGCVHVMQSKTTERTIVLRQAILTCNNKVITVKPVLVQMTT